MALVLAAREIMVAIQPVSIRGVCYKLFVAGHIPSMAVKETQRVSRALVWARENGEIPWKWVVDETRGLERVSMWDSPSEYADSVQESYRRDYWSGQDTHVEVWSEKGTVRGVVMPILRRYGVGFRVHHGFSSATSVNQIAQAARRTPQEFVALYVGDYDPSGLHMSEVDLPGRLTEYGGDVEVRRIALTRDDRESLPHFPLESKKKDPRHQWYRKRYDDARCWEVDAMDPNELRGRVEESVAGYIDNDQWNRIEIVERAEKASLISVMEQWRSLI